MHQSTRIEYMQTRREDGMMQRHPFLVNMLATECIMLPDIISIQILDYISLRKQGHVGLEPGLSKFFDV